ncbi:MAG TPA: NADH-quinone oxidoreductase subunit J, partial [Cyclobacteriaceae bacterium]|nr:NADH-quinone oxidoreductase subunit J [Cyclobacteriaceae bacterium]
MSVLTITLYGFEVLAALSALGIVFTKNVFHAALLLIVCLLALAGIFVLYHAEFIAVTQILIYAGGVLVLIIFGVMLTARLTGKPLVVKNQYVFGASFITLMLAGLLLFLFSEQHFYSGTTEVSEQNAIRKIGIALMSDYAL